MGGWYIRCILYYQYNIVNFEAAAQKEREQRGRAKSGFSVGSNKSDLNCVGGSDQSSISVALVTKTKPVYFWGNPCRSNNMPHYAFLWPSIRHWLSCEKVFQLVRLSSFCSTSGPTFSSNYLVSFKTMRTISYSPHIVFAHTVELANIRLLARE